MAVRRGGMSVRRSGVCVAWVVGGWVVRGARRWCVGRGRRDGRAGVEQMTSTGRGAELKDVVGGTGAKLRDRFNREEGDEAQA